ncbi:MAG: glycoside hydrolase family 66 protein [Mycobacterium leprae]
MKRTAMVSIGGAALLLALGGTLLPGAAVTAVAPAEGMVKPGEPVHLNLTVRRPWYDFRPVTVTVTQNLSTQPLATIRTRASSLTWTPPSAGGYGVEAQIGASRAFTAVDAGANWAEKPRYGFVTDFGPGQQDQAAERFATMAAFHLNGLQFYDWQYRHSDYLPPTEEYRDPLGRLLSRSVLLAKLTEAHQHGMAAMAYTTVYAAPPEFYQSHPTWALYDAAGKPLNFGNGFLYIMNPESGSPWAEYQLAQYRQIVTQLPFDGIHLDQFGDPHYGFRAGGGDSVDMATAMAAQINATKATVTPHTVLFNDVGGWPLSVTAPTANDAVYVEVWPPNILFNHLHQLIEQGRLLSGGKPVILAAYIPPKYEPSVLLTDATIFASGGYHLEIGEGNGMLADPYFPKYQPMSPALQEHLRRYYDVAVRYQAFLYGKDLTPWDPDVSVADSTVLTAGFMGGVWPVGRQNDRYGVLNLINLNGLTTAMWNAQRTAGPTPLTDRQVSVAMAAAPRAIYRIDPDGADPSPTPVSFTFANGQATFHLDHLDYWSMLVFEK